MTRRTARLASCVTTLVLGLIVTGGLGAREHPAKPPFKYVGGTSTLPDGCKGSLEMDSSAMAFKCASLVLQIPYSSIRLMQYRPDISSKARKMAPRWKSSPHSFPSLFGGKGNRYFTVVYQEKEGVPAEALVLEVAPEAMRPYLAEIDVKVGQRVEVESQDDYD